MEGFYCVCCLLVFVAIIGTGSSLERVRIGFNVFAPPERIGAPASLTGEVITAGGGGIEGTAGNVTCHKYSEFACGDGQSCVSILHECNKVIDCADGSDEHAGCRYFSCGDGSYISKNFTCDEYEDCPNAWDEDRTHANCSIVQCVNSTIESVRGNNICDGYSDCQDKYNSDECDCSFTFVCNNSKCIHVNKRCDGDDQCGDGSDEINCQRFTCNNGDRVLLSRVCDGIDQCGDSSDECNCVDTFTCANGRCVLDHLTCNGVDNCGDASDECSCQNAYHCNNGRCIQDVLVGNDVDDCGDNSDEIKPTSYTPPTVTNATSLTTSSVVRTSVSRTESLTTSSRSMTTSVVTSRPRVGRTTATIVTQKSSTKTSRGTQGTPQKQETQPTTTSRSTHNDSCFFMTIHAAMLCIFMLV